MKKINFILMGVVLTLILGCSRSAEENNTEDSNSGGSGSVTETNDVYISGYEFSGSKIIAKYWKNGVATSLPSTQNYSYANSVFVSGNDIYVCGSEGSGPTTAKLWKNGTASNLTGTAGFAEAQSVFVSGNDVYVGGISDSNNYDPGVIWKNGTDTLMEGGDLIQSVYLSGGVVYASGYGNAKAKFWKNGVPTIFANTDNTGDKFSIFVAGNDVYVAGEEVNSNSIFVAKIWKNGVATNLTDGTKSAFARALCVSNGDVYVVGAEYINGSYTPMLWKNGNKTSLSGGYGFATSVAVYGNDVYVVGYETGNNSYNVIKLWKNGIATTITEGTSHAYATSVFIKPK